jgi:hypothetical protein
VGRKKRTPDELRRISEDLHYEVQMLLGSAQGLDPETTAEGTLHNALVESFAIHLRNMLDFLWPDKPKRKSDWVIAADFFSSPSDWEKLRPEISQLLVVSRVRAAKEIAHLTYARLAVDPEQKDWDVRQIANEVTRVVEKFIRHVPMQFLGPKCTDLKANIRVPLHVEEETR